MFKFFTLCLLAIVAIAAAKPGFVAAPIAYSATALPYVAPPYTAGIYAAPYAYSGAVYAPYTAAYSAYPYSSILLRR